MVGSLECVDVVSGYGDREVLHGVGFRVDRPGLYVLLGPNGAGKTTLFRTIAGAVSLRSGRVLLSGEDGRRRGAHRRVHYLTSSDGIPDGMRVREALEFYAGVIGVNPAAADEALREIGIADLAERYFSQLSSGQRRRVGIARLLLEEREIYLLDEPTTSLDPSAAREIRERLLRLGQDRIVLYSSHNLFEARELGQWVLVLRQGHLVYDGRITDLPVARYRIGVRLLDGPSALTGWTPEGDYFVRELPGPEAVPAVLEELRAQGLRIREVRELENPLEELFG